MYVAKNWPLTDNNNTQGTLGGVQKAEKFRGKQMSEKDLTLDSPEVTKLTQSAEWQNAMKDEKFVKMLQSDHFQQGMRAIYKLKGSALWMRSVNKMFLEVDFENMDVNKLSEQYKNYVTNNSENDSVLGSFLSYFSIDIQKFCAWALEYQKNFAWSSDKGDNQFNLFMAVMQNTDIGNALQNDSDIHAFIIPGYDADKAISSDELSKLLYTNMNLEKFFSTGLKSSVGTFSSDFNKFWSADFQKSIGAYGLDFNNTAFKALAFNQSFQNVVIHLHESDFQDLKHNQLKLSGW